MEKLDIIIRKKVMYSDIEFWSVAENKYLNMLVLIDTGAETTTFSDNTLKLLGYPVDVNNSQTIRTGGGESLAYKVIIPKLKIGSIELTDIAANSNEFLDEFEMDGILGMNVLELFNFTFNLDDNVIELNNRKKIIPQK